ncbi:MAG: hypothetical protein ACM37W_04385 [Actinomycetota bacterium]
MQSINILQLETEIAKMVRAMMTRNRLVGKDLIDHLRQQLSLEDVAGIIIVSIERLIWYDWEAVVWSINHLIPADLMQEIRQITAMGVYKRLIAKGFMPGEDFSMDADGKLLLNERVRTAIARRW